MGGYAGLFAWYASSTPYREYIQTQLTTTLIGAQKYYISMYVSLADSSRYSTDDIGMYISQNPISLGNFDAFGFTPQIANPQGQFLSDKANWKKISGSFIASGNEAYLTIGNFKDNNNTDTIRLVPTLSPNSDFNAAYYYIDEVCISTDSLLCNSVVGIKNIQKLPVYFYYNSLQKKIIIYEVGFYTISIIDVYGNLKKEVKLEGEQEIDVSDLDAGYYIVVLNDKKSMSHKKIII